MKTRLTFQSVSLALVVALVALSIIPAARPAGGPAQRPASVFADASWWDTAWTRRVRLTFTNNTGQTLNNHRVLVEINTTNIPSFNYADTKARGDDLRFIDQSVTPHQELPYHITTWNPGNNSTVFVTIPSIPTVAADTSIYMYYKNSLADKGENPDGTWSSDYKAVWPLQEQHTIFKDYEATATPWGDFGSPINLGYPAVNHFHPVGAISRFKMQLQNSVYDPSAGSEGTTYVVYPGGEWQVCRNVTPSPSDLLWEEGDSDLPPITGTPTPPLFPSNLCSPNDPYIVAFDHATNSWSEPVKVGDSWDLKPDTHYYPTIQLVTRDTLRFLLVFQAHHGGERPISYWEHSQDFPLYKDWTYKEIGNTRNTTYIASYKAQSDNTLYVIYRNSVTGPGAIATLGTPTGTPPPNWTPNPGGCLGEWYEPEAYAYSTDGGVSWLGPYDLVNPELWYDQARSIYVKAMRYEPATASRPEGVSFLFGHHTYHNCTMAEEYYAFFAFGTLGSYKARTLYSAAGGELNTALTPVARSTYGVATVCPTCQVYTEANASGTPQATYFSRTVLGRDTSDNLHVFYNYRGNGFPVKWKMFNPSSPGSGWQAMPDVPAFGHTYGFPYDVSFDANGVITLYIIVGDANVKLSLVTYTYNTAAGSPAWVQNEVLIGPLERAGLNWFTLITNPIPDNDEKIALRATFMEMHNTEFWHPNAVGKLYGWGDYGILESSPYAQATSIVGAGVYFNPTPSATPTASATLMPTAGATLTPSPTVSLSGVNRRGISL